MKTSVLLTLALLLAAGPALAGDDRRHRPLGSAVGIYLQFGDARLHARDHHPGVRTWRHLRRPGYHSSWPYKARHHWRHHRSWQGPRFRHGARDHRGHYRGRGHGGPGRWHRPKRHYRR